MLSPPVYTIQLPVYEGPLDLLLNLIEHAELDITKVSLAEVTDQYLAFIRQIQDRQLEDLASFLVMAARLIQIKSEALLPRPPLREPGEEDPGDALARQLVAYKKYKQVAILLAERGEAGLKTYVRLSPGVFPEAVFEFEDLSIGNLARIYREVLASAPKIDPSMEPVSRQIVRVRDKIQFILVTISRIGKTTFRKLLGGARSRVEVVVSFLALLELIKQQRLSVHQETLFGEIELTKGDAWTEAQDLDFDLEFEE